MITITLHTQGAAFANQHVEAKRILRKLVDDVNARFDIPGLEYSYPIFDSNGEQAGIVQVVPDEK